MKKNYSLIILSENGSFVKEISFTRDRLVVAGLILLAFSLIIAVLCYDLFLKKRVYPEIGQLEETLSQQTQEFNAQQNKIKNFKSNIARLKKELQELNQFEEKIKMIAGIEKTQDSDNHLVGIGGSIPPEYTSDVGGEPDGPPAAKKHP